MRRPLPHFGYFLVCSMVFAVGCDKPVDAPAIYGATEPVKQTTATSETRFVEGLAGTASCSARGCHGGLEPRTGRPVGQDEYTLWLNYDPHGNAFAVLSSPRSKRMAQMLAGAGLVKPPTEDARCLACHTIPSSAPLAESAFTHTERPFGVGCESCHGPAERWLDAHTQSTWAGLSPAEKSAKGMTNLSDLYTRAQVCTGCHVGAAPDGKTVGLRDVNHDLIAAGHPRLNFEMAAFTSSIPPHWNTKPPGKPLADSAQLWLVGQIESGQAAAHLLAYRAKPATTSPWPEFAEYSCFACHRDLAVSPRALRRPGPPGSIPSNDWYWMMPPMLGELPELGKLANTMRVSNPNRDDTAAEATALAIEFEKRAAEMQKGKEVDLAAIRTHLIEKAGREDLTWDKAAQLYLALSALQGPNPDEKDRLRLVEFEKLLMFPFDSRTNKYWNSPADYRPEAVRRLFTAEP